MFGQRWRYAILLLALLAGCTRTRYRLASDRDAYGILNQKVSSRPWSLPSDYSLQPPPTSRLYDPTPPDDPWLPVPAPQLYAYQIPAMPPRTVRMGPEFLPAIPAPPPVMTEGGLALQGPGDVLPAAYSLRAQPLDRSTGTDAAAPRSDDVLLAPIPTDAWEAIPPSCLVRMFEFSSLREEYRESFERPPPADVAVSGQRLSLEEIVHLTLLNSRDYQAEKESLYRTALRLSLERFAYQLKFSSFNNGTVVDYDHTRTGGITENGLAIGTTFQVDKVLATGGELVARFANDVVLTFNGPTGFAADVGSDLILELNQTIFQRDVRFESLTQAERDVVYAARDFMRFRKLLFVELSSQYYSLIRTYRQVEIDSQNYFTLVRAFHQSREEYRAGLLPRFQLDQVEQNVLAGRSRLIGTCNSLESALDNLKFRMGLPTETALNIDLGELEQLTTRDELSVTGQLIRRVRQRLDEERTVEAPNRVVLLNSSVVLIERMLDSFRLQQQLGRPTPQRNELLQLMIRLQVDAAREEAAVVRAELQKELQDPNPSLPIVFQRTMDVVEVLLETIERQLELAEQRSIDPVLRQPYVDQLSELRKRSEVLHVQLERIINEGLLDQLKALVEDATRLLDDSEDTARGLSLLLGMPPDRLPPDEELRQSLQVADMLLRQSDELLVNIGTGLTPIEIEMDSAMLTALNLRFDLINQRNRVADSWRQIKYAADDLKSVLNINASQRVSTRSDVNRVFDFTFDESQTRVTATFDAPFNRLAQRNAFRESLIDYQAALRQMMQLEDDVKLDVRNDLRALALDKEQYGIDVASAALAYERVVSVRLELRLGVGQVAARDFLEAQNAYASALSSVAGRHIGYIVDRTQLFVDLELLTVGDDGFWHELYDEEFQPEPFFQLPLYSEPVYGTLVPGLWYSHRIRRMMEVPPGEAAIHSPPQPAGDGSPQPPAELPAPTEP